MLVTQIMRTQEKLLSIASIEGAFYTDVYALARSERGLQALMGLIPEAFQGTEDVVTGVQCRDPGRRRAGIHPLACRGLHAIDPHREHPGRALRLHGFDPADHAADRGVHCCAVCL